MNTERKSSKLPKIVGWILLGIIGASVMALVFGYIVMHVWNWIMPEVFGLRAINFWQAFGIIVLARLIFGGFKHDHCKKNSHDSHFKKKFANKGPFKHFGMKKDWSKYHNFWKEEGEQAYDDYVKRKTEEETN